MLYSFKELKDRNRTIVQLQHLHVYKSIIRRKGG